MQPHRHRYWLNAKPNNPDIFKAQIKAVCQLYQSAAQLMFEGVHLISTDEMTAIQAIERVNPAKRMRPKLEERQEFEYIRHGTQSLIANLEVATGKVITPSIGATRTEADFAAHIATTVDTDKDAAWIFITDQLNIHKSEALVRLVAQRCQIDTDLGVKRGYGILHSMRSRAEFLTDETHRIRFVYVPKHTSWVNQIEIWFSILSRRLLKRGNFTSTEELRSKILSFIDYFNQTMVKPINWKYTGAK